MYTDSTVCKTSVLSGSNRIEVSLVLRICHNSSTAHPTNHLGHSIRLLISGLSRDSLTRELHIPSRPLPHASAIIFRLIHSLNHPAC